MTEPAREVVILDPDRFDGVVFDMDGVITDTARVHARAWQRMFDEYLLARAERDGTTFEPFDVESDYLAYVDGKPRVDGARSFLESRGVRLEDGAETDPPDSETVWGLAMRKQVFFKESLAELGAEAYPTTLALIDALRSSGLKTALITASRNATQVLDSAGVGDVFEARVDGNVAVELDLKGKPEPDVFLEASRRIGVDPARAVVVEDAQAGVAAGRAGGFGLVIGVDRVGQAEALAEMGADVVVEDLEQVSVGRAPGTPSMLDLPHALERIEDIAAYVGTRCPVVFLDYDGTLTPIVERPEDARLDPAMRDIISRLVAAHPVTIVSGRDVSFVADQVHVDGVLYAGSHGFDIVGPEDLDTSGLDRFASFIPEVDAAEDELSDLLADVPGARVERKKFSVAAHYRQVGVSDVARVTEAVDTVVETHPRLRVGLGKKVYEIRPDVEWDKGRAVMWLFESLGFSTDDDVPFYVGDDVTDEDAFDVLAGVGIGVVVGTEDRGSRAGYRVDDVGQVGEFLSRLASFCDRGAR